MFRIIFVLAFLLFFGHSDARFVQKFGNALKNGFKIVRPAPIAPRTFTPFIPSLRTEFSTQPRVFYKNSLRDEMRILGVMPKKTEKVPNANEDVQTAQETVETNSDLYNSVYNDLAERYGLSKVAPLGEIDLELQAKRAELTVEKVWPPIDFKKYMKNDEKTSHEMKMKSLLAKERELEALPNEQVEPVQDSYTSIYNEIAENHGLPTIAPPSLLDLDFQAGKPKQTEEKVGPPMEFEENSHLAKEVEMVTLPNEEDDIVQDFSIYNGMAGHYALSANRYELSADFELQDKRAEKTVEKVWPPMDFKKNEAKAAEKSTSLLENQELVTERPNGKEKLNTVIVEGIFDHLHAGHKLLLTEAVRRASSRVLVEIADGPMLQNELLPEFIEPIEIRKQKILDFLRSIDSSLTYEVNVIQERFHRMKTDPNLNMFLVTKQEEEDAKKVNDIRARNLLPIMQVEAIDFEKELGKDEKTSSYELRKEMLGTRLREPEIINRPYFPTYPYIVGLTGNVASGKSQLTRYFKEFGAAIIDCDKLVKEICQPGMECHTKLVTHFGNEILNAKNQIDQIKLDAVFFKDQKKINEFNDIVWPSLKFELQKNIERIRQEKKHDVIIVEANALLPAAWQRKVHEIWSVIIPKRLSFQHLLSRDKLNFNQVNARLAAQPTNEALIKQSTVVLSPQWSYLFTHDQATKAWEGLQEYLKTLKSQSSTVSI